MLHALYLDDIARYAPPMQRVRVRDCYLSLPRQFAKENTKFQYAVVERRTGARKYAGSVDWLVASGMVCDAGRSLRPPGPSPHTRPVSALGLYANDTGLLMAMCDFDTKRSVVYDTLTGPTKGGLYENLIAVLLTA